MIEFEEYKLKLNDLKPKLEALAASLNLDRVRNELERFHAMQEAPGFWDDPDRSQKIVVQTKLLEAKLEKYHAMTGRRWRTFSPSARWLWRKTTTPCCRSFRRGLKSSPSAWRRRGWRPCSPGSTMATMRSCPSTPEPAARRPRTGADALPDVHPLGRTPRLHV